MKRGNKMKKKILNKKRIINDCIMKPIIIALIIMAIIMAIIITISIKYKNMAVNFFTIVILGFFILSIAIMNKFVNLINTDQYSICTDILADKKKRIEKEDDFEGTKISMKFYFYFTYNYGMIPVQRRMYNRSEIGDRFYVVEFNMNKCLFNCREYELDESIKYKLN